MIGHLTLVCEIRNKKIHSSKKEEAKIINNFFILIPTGALSNLGDLNAHTHTYSSLDCSDIIHFKLV